MFEILNKCEVAPNIHQAVIRAPAVAKKAKAGQFVIVMVDERSERVPFTLCEWDRDAGTITLAVQEVGQSSRKFVMLKKGDHIAHVVGPLGVPLETDNYGTVALAGGCYGIGAVLSIARAMKAAGNRVITVIEADSNYLFYYRDELQAASDQLIQTAIDGSRPVKGHAVDVIQKMLAAGDRIDRVIAVGCVFMMRLASMTTKPFGVKTLVALNPIMLDGTGMCGACRVTVGAETKFACVDGPFFDAHEVDWDELRDRRAAYSEEEVHALAQTQPVQWAHAHVG